ncbi:hypothetical protein [Planomonospora sp. ID82291]|uniref:hypothetical protein n=1 Tax=Planomonospora sp. ID82291 TaxID=2738136 RepID=UPI0018C37D6D|nr:hypothetical protein [Planomonospora sp. ID82291]MBG0816953.1 hypothetical protein [Planomonospora sp. ID82291]
MNYRKLAPAVAALAVLCVPSVAAAGTAESSADVHRKSAACASPSGEKINVSWGDGNVTTTVYYNNHCNQKRAVKLQFVRENGTIFYKCFTVGAKSKGSKKIDNSMPNKVTLPGSC